MAYRCNVVKTGRSHDDHDDGHRWDHSHAVFVDLYGSPPPHLATFETLISSMYVTPTAGIEIDARHDEVVSKVLGLLTATIERAQARGEIRPGDARLYAFSILGPMLSAVLFREVFGSDATPPDLRALAAQHAGAILEGLLAPAS